jgi:hypothetical protein
MSGEKSAKTTQGGWRFDLKGSRSSVIVCGRKGPRWGSCGGVGEGGPIEPFKTALVEFLGLSERCSGVTGQERSFRTEIELRESFGRAVCDGTFKNFGLAVWRVWVWEGVLREGVVVCRR